MIQLQTRPFLARVFGHTIDSGDLKSERIPERGFEGAGRGGEEEKGGRVRVGGVSLRMGSGQSSWVMAINHAFQQAVPGLRLCSFFFAAILGLHSGASLESAWLWPVWGQHRVSLRSA